jgi:hypothetical protein
MEACCCWLSTRLTDSGTFFPLPLAPGTFLPPYKIPLAENRFLQAGKGAENTKKKFQAVLYLSH